MAKPLKYVENMKTAPVRIWASAADPKSTLKYVFIMEISIMRKKKSCL